MIDFSLIIMQSVAINTCHFPHQIPLSHELRFLIYSHFVCYLFVTSNFHFYTHFIQCNYSFFWAYLRIVQYFIEKWIIYISFCSYILTILVVYSRFYSPVNSIAAISQWDRRQKSDMTDNRKQTHFFDFKDFQWRLC